MKVVFFIRVISNTNLSSTCVAKQEAPTDGVAIPRMTTECAEPVCLVSYPWYCHAIRGHKLFWKLTTDRQKLWGRKMSPKLYSAPTSHDFLPFYFSAFLLTAAAARAG